MLILGLTGGIASGKSVVAAELAALGAVVLDADKAAHEMINLPQVQAELVDRWGEQILLAEGQVDRAAVASRVFAGGEAGEAELRFLERTLHPRIRKQFEARLAELRQQQVAAAVIDAPLLLEAGWQDLCDELIFVDSSRKLRLQRANRRNWTDSEFAKREACQMPIAQKRQLSTRILTNDGSLDQLRAQVQALWTSLDISLPKSS